MIIRKTKLGDVKKITKYGVGLLRQHHAFDPYFAPAKNVDVFVEKNFRKLGIAKQFLRELKKWFKNKNIKHIKLSVHEKNDDFGFLYPCPLPSPK